MIVANNSFPYRKGTKQDIQQLKQLSLASYGQYTRILTSDNWAIMRNFLNDDEKWAEVLHMSQSFVCLDCNEIIGMAFIVPHGNPWGIFKSDWSYLRLLGVHPAYRNQGNAKTLTKLCIEYAKINGESTVALHTSEMMDAARHIYETMGFVRTKEIQPQFGKRYWLYLLDLQKAIETTEEKSIL